MNFKKLLSEAIDNNTKIIITGKSGWGKSEMVKQVAEEKGMELIDFRLSEVLPEDLVGIPKVRDDFYEYVPPKWLYEVINNPDKKYLLFLDEITQGTPEVLNICYKIFDKVTKVGDHELPNVSVVGATNYSTESNYLTALPEPLKNRACMLELDHNVKNAVDYLVDKYKFDKKKDAQIILSLSNCIQESNPRSTEKVLNLVQNSASKELCIAYVGYDKYNDLLTAFKRSQRGDSLSKVDSARLDMQQGYMIFEGAKYLIQSPEELIRKYELTDEESDVIRKEFKVPSDIDLQDLRYTFATDWAISNSTKLKADDLINLQNLSSFNINQYLKKFTINNDTMKNQMNAFKFLTHDSEKQILYKICYNRNLPISVMRTYRKDLPWDLLKEYYNKGWLTENKVNEFKTELGL